MMNNNRRLTWVKRMLALAALLHCSFLIPHSSLITAQEVTLQVTPVQQVLPPRPGEYINNLGRFFRVTIINNTDVQQNLYFGIQIQQKFPDDVKWMSTNVETMHIPQTPITLGPNQHKTLNSIELKHLFDHFDSHDIYVKEGRYKNILDSDFGLMDEGQYEMQLTAYKWNPELSTPVVLNNQTDGLCLFNICYEAEAPSFINPNLAFHSGELDELRVINIDKNKPRFEWTIPTLNCNATMVQWQYDIRFVELGSMMPDEAMESNTITFLEKQRLTQNSYSIPAAYVRQMIADSAALGKVYAMQLEAHTPYQSQNTLNVPIIKNEGKSPIVLFRLMDPSKDDGSTVTGELGEAKETKKGPAYSYHQPILTSPSFPGTQSRLIYLNDSIIANWREPAIAGGWGEKHDTIKFDYNLALYTGNSADSKEVIFKSKPLYTKSTKEMKDTIRWDKIKDKVRQGDYLLLRVTAKPKNLADSLIQMHGDSLNYTDFALTTHFNENYQCGNDNIKFDNQTLISEKPDKNQSIKIGQFYLTLDEPEFVEFDKKEKTLKGRGYIRWSPKADNYFNFNARVAVKFENLKVNTDFEVIEGKCATYPMSEGKNLQGYSDEQFVDSLFSLASLDNIYGSLGIPEEVNALVKSQLGDSPDDKLKEESQSLAKSYHLGKYYSEYKRAGNRWDDFIQHGDAIDLYFPVELPDEIKQFLPKSFDVQIGCMQFTPQSAQMNLIGEIALPNSDVFDGQDVLIFGAPRLCITPDKFFPEEGVLALLSNFPLKDPNSDFKMTFKAPSEPLDPAPGDGCFLRWDDDGFAGLGLEIAMTLPNTKRVIDGKAQDNIPALLDLKAVVEGGDDAADFIATGTLSPFEVTDLPGWTFTAGEDVIFDYNMSRNDRLMPSGTEVKNMFPQQTYNEKTKKWETGKTSTFDFKKCGYSVGEDEESWKTWQGVFIKEISVGFPKFAVFGGEEQGATIGAHNMLIDASGISCQVFADSILNAQTGKCGGWKFTLDEASLTFVQNNFDNCVFRGGFGVPLLGKVAQDKAAGESGKGDGKGSGKSGKDDKGDKDNGKQDTDINYVCEIRHQTDPNLVEYEVWNKEGTKKEKRYRSEYADDRMSYVFKTTNADNKALQMNFFVADMTLAPEQTYFLVEAKDMLIDNKEDTYTQVELCMAGDITIAGTNTINERIKNYCKNLPLELKLPGIHFTKMRLSNKKESEWQDLGLDGGLHANRMANAQSSGKKSLLSYTFIEDKEVELGKGSCYFNYGEWSFASDAKNFGPFNFNIDKFELGCENDSLTLDVIGQLGLVEDQISVSAGIAIGSRLHREGGIKNIGDWYLSDGKVTFKEIAVNADFTGLTLEGRLALQDESGKDQGYAGSLKVGVAELFKVSCEGGYFKDREDESKKWGYFICDLELDARTSVIRFDPIVVTRISGGFYINCKPDIPAYVPGSKLGMGTNRGGMPKKSMGSIGVTFGLGLAATSGEETLKGSMDMTVVYDRKRKCLSTFQFLGNVNALSGLIDSDVRLIYVNEGGEGEMVNRTRNRYLCLNITTTIGIDTSDLTEAISNATGELAAMKEELDAFNSQLSKFTDNPYGSLKEMNSDYNNKSGEKADKKIDSEDMSDADKARFEQNAKSTENKSAKIKAGEYFIPLEIKFTWTEEYKKKDKWHIYLGEPAKDKRCKFTYLDYKDDLITVNIGADGYLCIGNELPGNGQLPAIPSEVTEFLSGHKNSSTSLGGDLTKVNNSRAKLIRDILNSADAKGGVMLGASAWGFIDVDLGLFYGYLHAIGGFDVSLINYGKPQYCDNYAGYMGYKNWYAMGQLYAYMAAEMGLRINLGKLINEDVNLVNAGIGALLEMGMPRPTWLEGKARVKVNLLGGLVKVDKNFSFTAGNKCVPFRGNALDEFALFGECNIASDSIQEGWAAENAISVERAQTAIFETYAGLGEAYRLYDPTTGGELSDDTGLDEEQLKAYASRTYIFDVDKTRVLAESSKANINQRLGARLYEIPVDANIVVDPTKLKYEWANEAYSKPMDKAFLSNFYDKGKRQKSWSNRVMSRWMNGENLDSKVKNLPDKQYKEDDALESVRVWNGYDFKQDFESGTVTNHMQGVYEMIKPYEVQSGVNLVESKGRKFHIRMPKLKPGYLYILELNGQAFEIKNGKRVWTYMTVTDQTDKMHKEYVRWEQKKLFFFRTKEDDTEDLPEQILDLQPYVALAYPSYGQNQLFNDYAEMKTTMANQHDIELPTIALNTDIRSAFKKGKLEWVLASTRTEGYSRDKSTGNAKNIASTNGKIETIDNDWIETEGGGVNMQPKQKFDVNDVCKKFQLRLQYTYQIPVKCSVYYTKNGQRVIGDDTGTAAASLLFNENEYLTFDERAHVCYDVIKDLAQSMGIDDPFEGKDFNSMTQEEKVNAAFTAGILAMIASSGNTDAGNEFIRSFENYVIPYLDDDFIIREEVCEKDTTVNLMQLHLSTDGFNWYSPYLTGNNHTELRPYEQQFVGMRPADGFPQISYEYVLIDRLANSAAFGDNNFISEGSEDALRMKDPYVYLSYLSKWVFVGDRSLKAYGFDNVKVPNSSESLTFNYNGHDISGSLIEGGSSRGLTRFLTVMRNDMYGAWRNSWWDDKSSVEVNEANQRIRYPLPLYIDDDWGLTTLNQNGITPPYEKAQNRPSQSWGLTQIDQVSNLALDYVAPYFIARALSDKMKEICDELMQRFHKASYGKSGNDFKKALNEQMQLFQDMHRGQYLTVESRGFSVRIPYYQFPLIFGDCLKGRNPYEDESIDQGCDFSKSISDSYNEYRDDDKRSNVLFFRLCGGVPFAKLDKKDLDDYSTYGILEVTDYETYAQKRMDAITSLVKKGAKSFWDVMSEDMKKTFSNNYEKYEEAMIEANKNAIIGHLSKKDDGRAVYRKVNYERFSPRKGLDAVTNFYTHYYRVNAYNISTGQYTYNRNCGFDTTLREDELSDRRYSYGGSNLSTWMELRKPAVYVNGTRVRATYDDDEIK